MTGGGATHVGTAGHGAGHHREESVLARERERERERICAKLVS